MEQAMIIQKLKVLQEQDAPLNPHIGEVGHDKAIAVLEEPFGVGGRFVSVDPATGVIVEYGDSEDTFLYNDTTDDRECVQWFYDFLVKESSTN